MGKEKSRKIFLLLEEVNVPYYWMDFPKKFKNT